MMSSDNQDPSKEELYAKVFNNPVILQNILLHTSFDRFDLKCRLVNKTFNDVCLKLNRIKLKVIEFELNKKKDVDEKLQYEFVRVNDRWRKMCHISQYFRFVKDVCKTKVNEIYIKNIWRFPPEVAKEFHDSIQKILIGNNRKSVRTLVGLEEVCNGCEDCLDIAQNSKVYGPIGFEIISKIQHNFDELIITDRLLEQIGNHCVKNSKLKEECYNKLDDIINCSISCETLTLSINESRRSKPDIKDHLPIPREILETILEKWNVKAVNLRFYYTYQLDFCQSDWAKADFFSRIRFNDPFDTVERRRSEKLLKFVSVDLTDSFLCRADLRSNQTGHARYSGFDNLFANIRRIIPTEVINVKNLFFCWPQPSDIPKTLRKLKEILRMDDPRNLTINIDFFVQLYVWEGNFYTVKKQSELIKIPKEFLIEPNQFTLEHGRIQGNIFDCAFNCGYKMKWTGTRLRIIDDDINFKLNINIFMNSTKIEQSISEEEEDVLFNVHFDPWLLSWLH